MKIKILIILLTGFVCHHLLAQENPQLPAPHCSAKINTITTDWRRIDSSNNTWDWTKEFFDDAFITGRTQQPSTVRSPFYPAITGQNLNLDHFYTQYGNNGYDGLDFHPEDGWELLAKDFGTTQVGVSNLFFALYNRHTALVRVFYMIVENPSVPQQGAVVRMRITSPTRDNGLLSPAYAILNPVVDFRKRIIFHAPNKYENEDEFWLYADFPVAYDPCICNYPSKITFDFRLIQQGEMEMTGSIVGTTNQVLGPSVGNNVNAISPYQSLFDDVKKGVSLANKSYKDWDGYMNYINKFIAKNKASIKAKMGIDIAKLKVFTKFVPKVAAAVALHKFFVAGGKEKKTDLKPIPISFESNLSLNTKAEITFTNPFGSRTIWTPGSNPNAISEKPIYDNLLGIINLLEYPVLQYVEYEPFETFYTDGEGNSKPFFAPKIRQYKLKNELKYAFNHASNLEVDNIDASFILNFPGTTIQDMEREGLVSYIKPVEFGVPVFSTLPIEERLKKIGLEINQWPENPNDNEMLSLRTSFTPFTCLNKRSFTLYTHTAEVELKLVVSLKQKDGNGQDVIIVLTYPVRFEPLVDETPDFYHIGVTEEPLPPLNNLQLYPKYLNYNGTHGPAFVDISNSQVINYSGVSVNSDVFTNEQIYINNGSTVSNATLIASKYILVEDLTELQVGATLMVSDFPIQCYRSIHEMEYTGAELINYCRQGSRYDIHSKSKTGEEDSFSENSEQSKNGVVYSLFPNPASTNTIVHFEKRLNEEAEVQIFDLSGKLIKKSKTLITTDTLTVDLDGVHTGLYFFNIKSNSIENKSQKLSVIK